MGPVSSAQRSDEGAIPGQRALHQGAWLPVLLGDLRPLAQPLICKMGFTKISSLGLVRLQKGSRMWKGLLRTKKLFSGCCQGKGTVRLRLTVAYDNLTVYCLSL